MLLECIDIEYKYPGSEFLLFDKLSFAIPEPGFHALFGPSGVGKTSLAKIISREIAGHGGRVRFEGIGTILYSYNLERLPGWSSVGRHIAKITTPAMASMLDELVVDFGMEGLMDQRFSQLSLGQQNRINLIRYLLQDFQVLIMDESLANVDELTRERILLKIKAMFPDRLFLYISHNVVEVAKFCRFVCVFRGNSKKPQTRMIAGQDIRTMEELDAQRLEATMLEIMNAI